MRLIRKLFYSVMIGIAAFFALTGCVKPTVTAIEVNEPTQVNYYVGDTFSMAGASILVTYSDDSTLEIAISATGVSVSSVDMSSAGTKTVTVTYKEKVDTFQITVTAVALQSISATFNPGSNTIYTSTPLNDLKGYLTVVGTNNNGSAAGAISTANYSLSGTLSAGTSTITVSYNTITTTFQVTVVAVVPTSYAIKTPANDVAFDYQEAFNSNGLVIESIMNDGSHVDLLPSGYTIDSSAYNANAEGTYTILIKVSSTTIASYDVTVTKTEQQIAAELADAKTAKIAQLTSYTEIGYYPTEWTQLTTIRNAAIATINGYTTVSQVAAFDYTSVNNAMAAVKTKGQIDQEIADAKTARIALLNPYTEADYRSTQWTQLLGLRITAISDINALTTLSAINSFDVTSVNNAMDAIKTDAELTAEELADAKTAKIAQLTSYNEGDYYPTEWTQLTTIRNAAIATINGYTTISQVAAFDYTSVNNAMDAVKTRSQIAQEIATAKTNRIALLNSYTEADYRSTQWTQLQGLRNTAISDINALTTLSAINSFDVTSVNNAMDAIKTDAELTAEEALASAKTTRIGLLTVYLETDYNAAEWSELEALYNNAVIAINALTTIEDVNAYDVASVNSAMAAIKTKAELDYEANLEIAKTDKIALIDVVNEEDYTFGDWQGILQIRNDAIDSINACTTLEEVEAFDVELINTVIAGIDTLQEQVDQTILMLEDTSESAMGVRRPLTATEKAAIPYILNLISEYDYYGKTATQPITLLRMGYLPFNQATNDQIADMIQRDLSLEEVNALVVFHYIDNEMVILSYKLETLAYINDLYNEIIVGNELNYREMDLASIDDAFDNAILGVENLFTSYLGVHPLPVNIDAQFYYFATNLIAFIENVPTEDDLVAAELANANVFSGIDGEDTTNYAIVSDGSLVIQQELYTLYLQGIVGKSEAWFDLSGIAKNWITLGFVVPEGFVVNYNLDGQINNINFFVYTAQTEGAPLWVNSGTIGDIKVIDGTTYVFFSFDTNNTNLRMYSAASSFEYGFEMKVVFGGMEYNGVVSYDNANLPEYIANTSTILIDFQDVQSVEGIAYVDNMVDLLAALANPEVDNIYLAPGVYNTTSDITISNNYSLFIATNATFVNTEGYTLTLASGSALINLGRIYNYGTFIMADSCYLFNSGFAFNLGDMQVDPNASMSGIGTGFSYNEYVAHDVEMIQSINETSDEPDLSVMALLESVAKIRTINFGSLPDFELTWSSQTQTWKEEYLQANLLYPLSTQELTDLIAYYDLLVGYIEDALVLDNTRLAEFDALKFVWLLGTSTSNLDLVSIETALNLKNQYVGLGGSNFETTSYYDMQLVFNQIEWATWTAVEYYQNVYRYLQAREFVITMMYQYDLQDTILFSDYDNVFQVSIFIQALLDMDLQEGLPAYYEDAEIIVNTTFDDSQIAGYQFYLALYQEEAFQLYLANFEEVNQVTLDSTQVAALRIYYVLEKEYNGSRSIEDSDFADAHFVDIEAVIWRSLTNEEKQAFYTIGQISVYQMLEMLYGTPLSQDIINGVPVVLRLMEEYAYAYNGNPDYPAEMFDATTEQIQMVLARSLTTEEEAALILFAQIQADMIDFQFEMFVMMFEEQMSYSFSETELLDLREFYNVMYEYENAYFEGEKEDFFNMDTRFVYLEMVLNRELTQNEKDGIIAIRSIILVLQLESESGTPLDPSVIAAIPVVLNLMEEYSYAWYEGCGYPTGMMEATNEEIAGLLQRELSPEEVAAMEIARQMGPQQQGTFADFIAMLEQQFGGTIDEADYPDLQVFYDVFLNYKAETPGFFEATIHEIETGIGYQLTTQQIASLYAAKATIFAMSYEFESGNVVPSEIIAIIPIIFAISDEYATAYDPILHAEYPESINWAIVDIQAVIGRQLTQVELAAITDFINFMSQPQNPEMTYEQYKVALQTQFNIVFSEADEVHLQVVYELMLDYLYVEGERQFYAATFCELEQELARQLTTGEKDSFHYIKAMLFIASQTAQYGTLNQAYIDSIPVAYDIYEAYSYGWYALGSEQGNYPYLMHAETSQTQIEDVIGRVLTPEEVTALTIYFNGPSNPS